MLWCPRICLGILPKLLDNPHNRVDLALDTVRRDDRLLTALQDGYFLLGPLVAVVIPASSPSLFNFVCLRPKKVKLHPFQLIDAEILTFTIIIN